MRTDYEIAESLILATEEAYGVFDLTERNRQRQTVRARQTAAYLIREMTDYSLPEVAKILNLGHHTTVMHSCDKVRKDPKRMALVPRLIKDSERFLG